ncbi:unnamed protein product [Rhizoctonia solani]|uniref:Uncharacterized protein n=1 Tax=Rhizoctonia solani TaxID=456999 RepID=A0A8H3D0Z6_9AGAM|nr:unnamed protein product [Rhizoctonia solani]CAE6505711.1 unnamed protein product [Rhizoctonia solani]
MKGYKIFEGNLLIDMRVISVVILLLVAAALGAPFVKRQDQLNGGVYYCTETNFTGVCVQTPPIELVQSHFTL